MNKIKLWQVIIGLIIVVLFVFNHWLSSTIKEINKPPDPDTPSAAVVAAPEKKPTKHEMVKPKLQTVQYIEENEKTISQRKTTSVHMEIEKEPKKIYELPLADGPLLQ